MRLRPDFNLWLDARFDKLDRVFDQMGEHLFEHLGIGQHVGHWTANLDLSLARADFEPEPEQHALEHVIHRDDCSGHLNVPEPAIVEEVAN
jgi:hypothetical protein